MLSAIFFFFLPLELFPSTFSPNTDYSKPNSYVSNFDDLFILWL